MGVTSPVEAWTASITGLAPPLTSAALETWQMARLRETLSRVQSQSPFYGERLAWVDPESFQGWSDLQRLPFTWPGELAAQPSALLCVPPSAVARVTTLTTSGTSGLPKRLCFTAGDLERTVVFFYEGMKTLVQPGDSVLILMPSASDHSIGRLLQTALARMGVPARVSPPGWTAEEALAAAQEATCYVGLPAQLIYLCRTNPALRPRSVLLSADYVPDAVIHALASTWHCRTFTHYGLTETGFGCAVTCEAGEGHHIRHGEVLVEIVDPWTGAVLPPETTGEIVLTTFAQEAMPLVRYRTGDLGSLRTTPCPCGSVLPRLGRIEGRLEHTWCLEAPGNTCAEPAGPRKNAGDPPRGLRGLDTLTIHRMDEAIFRFPSVRGFRPTLHPGPRLHLTMDTLGPLDAVEVSSALPPELEVSITYAEVNPFHERGKRRIVCVGDVPGPTAPSAHHAAPARSARP